MKGLRAHYVTLALILAAVVTTVVAYTTRESVTTAERNERDNNLFPVWREDEITRIEISRPGERTVLERRPAPDGGEPWFELTSPVEERAASERVHKLIGSLGFATPLRKLNPESGDDHGLSAPRWEITVEMGSLSYRLRIGKEAQVPRGAAYAAVVGGDGKLESLNLLAKELLAELDVRADGLRETRLLRYGRSEIRELRLERGGQSLRFSATKSGRFQLEDPAARADRDRLDLLFTELSRLNVERFLSPAEAEAAQKGKEIAHLSVVPKRSGEQPVELWIGGSCPGAEDLTVVRRAGSPRTGCAQASWISKLGLTRAEFVDRSVFSLRPDEVEELRLERGEHKLVLARKGESFVLRAPSEAQVELEAGNRRLEALTGSKGEIVHEPDLRKLGLDPPAGRATVTSPADRDEDAVVETVAIGKPAAGGRVHVRREADGVVLELSAQAARALVPDSTLLKKRRLFDFGPSSLVALETNRDGLRQRVTRSEGGALRLELPPGHELDGPLSVDLVQTLGALTVERWVADADDGSFGLQTPSLTAEIRFTLEDGKARTDKLSVGRSTSGGAFAKLASDPGVFVLGRRAIDVLSALLLNRSVFMIDPESVASIELQKAGRRYELTRRGAELASPELGPAMSSRIVEALGSLRAETAVSVGPARPEHGFDAPLLVVRAKPRDAGGKERVLRIGKGDSYRDMAVYYARADGVDATYVIAQSKIRPILDALGD